MRVKMYLSTFRITSNVLDMNLMKLFNAKFWFFNVGSTDSAFYYVQVVPSIAIAFVTYEWVKDMLGVEMRISD